MKNIFLACLILVSSTAFSQQNPSVCEAAESAYLNSKYNAEEFKKNSDRLELKINEIGEGYGWRRAFTSQEKFIQMIERRNVIVTSMLQERRLADEALKVLENCSAK